MHIPAHTWVHTCARTYTSPQLPRTRSARVASRSGPAHHGVRHVWEPEEQSFRRAGARGSERLGTGSSATLPGPDAPRSCRGPRCLASCSRPALARFRGYDCNIGPRPPVRSCGLGFGQGPVSRQDSELERWVLVRLERFCPDSAAPRTRPPQGAWCPRTCGRQGPRPGAGLQAPCLEG